MHYNLSTAHTKLFVIIILLRDIYKFAQQCVYINHNNMYYVIAIVIDIKIRKIFSYVYNNRFYKINSSILIKCDAKK